MFLTTEGCLAKYLGMFEKDKPWLARYCLLEGFIAEAFVFGPLYYEFVCFSVLHIYLKKKIQSFILSLFVCL